MVLLLLKGTIHLKEASIQAVVHDSRRYVIRIGCNQAGAGNQSEHYLDCERGEDQSVWFQCLMRAVELHKGDNGSNRAEAILKYGAVLGIEPGFAISLSSISKTYRRLCLKVIS